MASNILSEWSFHQFQRCHILQLKNAAWYAAKLEKLITAEVYRIDLLSNRFDGFRWFADTVLYKWSRRTSFNRAINQEEIVQFDGTQPNESIHEMHGRHKMPYS